MQKNKINRGMAYSLLIISSIIPMQSTAKKSVEEKQNRTIETVIEQTPQTKYKIDDVIYASIGHSPSWNNYIDNIFNHSTDKIETQDNTKPTPKKQEQKNEDIKVADILENRIDEQPKKDFEHFKAQYENRVKGTDLKGTSKSVWQYASETHIDPYIGASIMLLETGNGKSNLLKERNNVAGLKGRHGYKYFDKVEDSIKFFFERLNSRYVQEGLTKLCEINPVYCPTDKKWSYKAAQIATRLYSEH